MLNKTSIVWGISDGFESDMIDLSYFTTHQGMMLSSLYNYYYGENETISIDPKNQFTMMGAEVFEIEKVKWIMNSVFNISFSNNMSGENFYIDSNKLYIGILGMGWAPYIEYKVVDAKKLDNNRHVIMVKAIRKEWDSNGEITDEETYAYVVRQCKEDNNNYWAIDSFTKDASYYDTLSNESSLSTEEMDKLIDRNNGLNHTHTYDEAESLLYDYLGGVYGFDGLEVRQVTPANYQGVQFQMTISGESGAPIYIIEWYIVNLETGEVKNANNNNYICDLW